MIPFPPDERRLHAFEPPYDRLERLTGWLEGYRFGPGTALVWWLEDASRQEPEFEFIAARPPFVPLVVMLPTPHQIHATLPMLSAVPYLRPRAILPGGSLGTPDDVRAVLTVPPASIAEAAVTYFTHRGLLPDVRIRDQVYQIFQLAPEATSISRLVRRMNTSRRTLGRHFAAADLPVPSHVLQFARLLHVVINIQGDSTAIFRIAGRAGYPDGFTMSNQMKRLTGYRPTDVRRLLGWEWFVEAWLEREGWGEST